MQALQPVFTVTRSIAQTNSIELWFSAQAAQQTARTSHVYIAMATQLDSFIQCVLLVFYQTGSIDLDRNETHAHSPGTFRFNEWARLLRRNAAD